MQIMGRLVFFCAGANPGTISGLRPEGILVNPLQYAASDSQTRSTLEMRDKSRAQLMLMDSSGYQLYSGEQNGKNATCDSSKPMLFQKDSINIAPCHVIDAAVRLKPDILTSLDSPVMIIDDPYEQSYEFRKKLGFNYTWMLETATLRQKYCPQVELFIPIQCYNMYQFRTYVEKLLLDIDFNGLCLPTRNMGPERLTLFLLRFYQIGVRKVHILSIANFIDLALSAYFARHFFDWVSADATTWRKQAEMQNYMDANDLHTTPVGRNAGLKKVDPSLCDCPWCSIRTYSDIINTQDSDRTSILRCHNFFVIDKACRDFYENAGDLILYERYLRSRSERYDKKITRLITALSIATSLKDEDISVLESLLIQS